jgi:hypothetical protein
MTDKQPRWNDFDLEEATKEAWEDGAIAGRLEYADTIERLTLERDEARAEGYDLSAQVEHAQYHLAAAEARIAKLKAALEQAADWFQAYADGHRGKGDSDKANRNQERATACRAALEDKP